MKLKIERRWPKASYTIGRLYVNGELWCNTLELPVRNNTPRKDAIPYGTYEIQMHYSPKFKRSLPLLLNVPNRSGILIHRGNCPKDTEGCILPGINTKVGIVTESTFWEKEIVRAITEARSRKEKVTIEIV